MRTFSERVVGMARGRLSARTVATAKAGRHCDGQGLWLEVSPTGFKRWIYRFTIAGKTSEIALGRLPAVDLEGARELAEAQRKLSRAGLNPVEVRRKAAAQAPVPTFGALTEKYIAEHSKAWKSRVHLRQWRNSLARYAVAINGMRVDEISVADVLRVLQPIWLDLPETAARVRSRIELVLDYAKAHGHCTGDNPAAWRGNLKSLLAKQPKRQDRVQHFAALKYADVPALVATLRSRTGVTPLLLEFLILTAVRPTEARCMTWGEVDLDAALWTVPAARTKSGRVMRVPLCDRALEILRLLHAARTDDIVFTAPTGGFLGPNTLNAALKRYGYDCTIHGTARSSFRDWAGDCTTFKPEIAELALGHVVGNATEAAYRRGDALEQRRLLMVAWGLHCEGLRADNVLSFGKVSA